MRNFPSRLQSVDFIRGFAVFLMIIYHFIFDLGHFNIVDVKMNIDWHWKVFRYTILSLFLFVVGVSINFSHSQSVRLTVIIKRIVVIGSMAMIVSFGSYFIFPKTWIYFGILHFILVASMICIPLRKSPMLCLLLAVFIMLGHSLNILGTGWLYYWFHGIVKLPEVSEDLVPLFPWLVPVLLGMVFSCYQLHYFEFDGRLYRTLFGQMNLYFGRNALFVYMVHQPIMFGTIYLLVNFL